MKIKRFFAPDMRQAIRLVREEQGPDAVILSNRRVRGGVEIITAVDYDESLVNQGFSEPAVRSQPVTPPEPPGTKPAGERVAAKYAPDIAEEPEVRAPVVGPSVAEKPQIVWSQEPTLVEMQREMKNLRAMLEGQLSGMAWNGMAKQHPLRAGLLKRLMALGLSPELCRRLANRLKDATDLDHAWRQSLAVLAQSLPVAKDDLLDRGGVVALVGPTGVGKTTTVAKLAARFALRHGHRHVALVTTDNYRIGAHEQLRTYGRILGVPVHVAGDRDSLQQVLNSLYDKKLVLIDTAGMSQRDLRLTEQLAALHGGLPVIKSYLVVSATTQLALLDEVVRAFERVDLEGCILTKLDEAASLGEALSVLVQHQLPLAFMSDGQRVPEDLHLARAHNLVARAASLMQQADHMPADETMAYAFGGTVANAHV